MLTHIDMTVHWHHCFCVHHCTKTNKQKKHKKLIWSTPRSMENRESVTDQGTCRCSFVVSDFLFTLYKIIREDPKAVDEGKNPLCSKWDMDDNVSKWSYFQVLCTMPTMSLFKQQTGNPHRPLLLNPVAWVHLVRLHPNSLSLFKKYK